MKLVKYFAAALLVLGPFFVSAADPVPPLPPSNGRLQPNVPSNLGQANQTTNQKRPANQAAPTQSGQQDSNSPPVITVPALPESPAIPTPQPVQQQNQQTQPPAQQTQTAPPIQSSPQPATGNNHSAAPVDTGPKLEITPSGTKMGSIINKVIGQSEKSIQEKRAEEEKAAEKATKEEMERKIQYMQQKNYRTQIMPDAIYKRQYDQENSGLPKAVYKSDYDNLLFATIEGGDVDGLRAVIKKGANLEARNYEGDTPLLYAALLGNVEAVRVLLTYGADVNVQGGAGTTALQIAAYQGNEEMVRLLLEMNANPDIGNNYGMTAQKIAEKKGFYDVALLLVKRSADLAANKNMENMKRIRRTELAKLDTNMKMPSAEPEKIETPAPAPVTLPKPAKKEQAPVVEEKEESIKDRIKNFLNRLAGREKEQVKEAKERNKRRQKDRLLENPEDMLLPEEKGIIEEANPSPEEEQQEQAEQPKAAETKSGEAKPEVQALAPLIPPQNVPPALPVKPIKIVRQNSNVVPKYFIPETLFPAAKTAQLPKPEEQQSPGKSVLPGENEPLPTTRPKIDLPEILKNLGKTQNQPAANVNDNIITKANVPPLPELPKAATGNAAGEAQNPTIIPPAPGINGFNPPANNNQKSNVPSFLENVPPPPEPVPAEPTPEQKQ